jgi:hypothetical protein
MKRKIRCICIDGMEKTGKTSVTREMRKFFKEKEKDLHEINGNEYDKLQLQQAILDDNTNSFVLKENGLLSVYHNELKYLHGVDYIERHHHEFIRVEKDFNHLYGVVNFFLVPEDMETAQMMFGSDEIPYYYSDLVKFYKSINQTSLAQGVDIRLIPFSEDDRIFDVRDKILEILENEYEI